MPLSQRLTALGRGFRSSMYTFYDFARNAPGDYLPDTVFREAANINGMFCRSIVRDKLLFTEVLWGTFRVPEVFALLERGNLQPLREQQTLAELLERRGGLILKPVRGSQGTGIFSVVEANGNLTLNENLITLTAREQHLTRLSGYLLTERIVQDGYAHAIFPDSANSIRVVTMQHPDDSHRPFVGVAVHRFGSKTTGPVDNVSRGGSMAHIDPQTGVMGSAIKSPHETGGEMYWNSHHLDTGVPIQG